MTSYLKANGIRIFDFPSFSQPFTEQVRQNAQRIADENGIEIEFIRKLRAFRKDDRIQEIISNTGKTEALIHIFSAMEQCNTYKPWHDKTTGKTFLKFDWSKCLHYYFYFIDKELGLCYSVYDGDYDDAWDDYMIYGGLPQVAGFQSERQKADYLMNIFANVYLKDVIERNKIQNVDGIGILVDVLASAIGAPTNPSKIANTFASERQMTYANKTISNHIDHLADAFLISKASRYDIKGRKYIGANLKYYFTDLGLRNARLNFRQQEPTHIMENIVYNELLIRGYNVDVGIVEIFNKDKEGKRIRKQLEVDFVVNQGNQRYYIQVAYDMTSEEKQTQEFNSLRNIPDSFKKIVIVNGTKKPWRNDEGFVIMGMKYFLLNADSLEF